MAAGCKSIRMQTKQQTHPSLGLDTDPGYDTTPALQSTTASLTKTSSRISSITNWNAWRPPELPSHLPFRPMIRIPARLEGNEWAMIRGSIDAELQRDPDSPVIVHTFNEPERIPLSVTDALHLWRTQILPLRRRSDGHQQNRVKLVSPACASDPQGSQWLDAFMAALALDDDDRPDILGLHFYTMPDQTAEQGLAAAQAYFEERRNRFAQLPVIISEVACTSRDPAVVDQFTRDLVRWQEDEEQE
ncbi:glycosyl hydrolase catalytic core-domain-containing protein [Apiospora phragmitis]|uniref:Glycosyl hydrolase catalytic core-domain-containing protein n=1 Tax=Apiospora phragmitis TaxID=2905665 RepID=A0ABR1X7E7_9PEZI